MTAPLLRLDRSFAAALPSPLLCVDRSFAAALPSSSSAFDWWYLDARNAEGDGLVLIWARALPFFRQHAPAVNLALYRGKRPALWLLEQARPSQWSARGSADGFTIALGDSELRLTRGPGGVLLQARLDLSVPGDRRRLTGEVRATGPSLLQGEPVRHPHRWTPICAAARVQARLRFGGAPHFSLDAPGYLDRNASDLPLDQLGIRRWEWGRVRRGDRCSIWYQLESRGGERETHRLEVAGAEVSETRRMQGAADGRPADLGRPVERGPFYSRWLAGPDAVVERCEVDRVFDRWHRPLVRMRLHGPSVRPSIWAPLFCGPSEGRLARLLRLGGRA